MNCSQCNANLLVEVFGTSNPIRCASCGCVTAPPNQASTQVNQYAWRSFWLGLSSVVLLCFTGLPAIWYGVQSLLQMRFSRSQKSDKKAAIAGVSLGVLFGLFGTGLVSLIGGSVLLVSMFVEDTEDPERIREILATIGTIEIPESFVLDEANALKGQFRRIEWKDYSGTEIDDGRIRLVKATTNTQIGDPQIYGPSIRFRLDGDIEVNPDDRETESRTWEFAGKSRSITRIIEPVENHEFKVIRYFASTKADNEEQAYALAITFRDDGEYSEEDIKKIFESFVPAKQ